MSNVDPRRLRANTNMVLIKPNLGATEKIEFAGIDLWIDTSFEEEKMAATTGEVITVCEKLFFSLKIEKGMADKSVRYKTEVEMMPGDIVYFHYLTVKNARGDGRMFKGDDGEW